MVEISRRSNFKVEKASSFLYMAVQWWQVWARVYMIFKIKLIQLTLYDIILHCDLHSNPRSRNNVHKDRPSRKKPYVKSPPCNKAQCWRGVVWIDFENYINPGQYLTGRYMLVWYQGMYVCTTCVVVLKLETNLKPQSFTYLKNVHQSWQPRYIDLLGMFLSVT